ncbi:MAG: hypothetical protein IPO21_14055 [Bacteroidales bacterium]|nr:hypothetical protein [Bacteroidales bacterium]
MGIPDTIKLKAESDTGIHRIFIRDGVDTLYYNEYLYSFNNPDPKYNVLLPKTYNNHFVYNPGSTGKKILDITIEAYICDTTFQVEFEVK